MPKPAWCAITSSSTPGKVATLRRFKEDAREVTSGYECGITLEEYQDVKVGDVIEAYEMETVTRKLSAPTARAVSAENRVLSRLIVANDDGRVRIGRGGGRPQADLVSPRESLAER